VPCPSHKTTIKYAEGGVGKYPFLAAQKPVRNKKGSGVRRGGSEGMPNMPDCPFRIFSFELKKVARVVGEG
jgi:hypothetical protein